MGEWATRRGETRARGCALLVLKAPGVGWCHAPSRSSLLSSPRRPLAHSPHLPSHIFTASCRVESSPLICRDDLGGTQENAGAMSNNACPMTGSDDAGSPATTAQQPLRCAP